MSEHGILGLSLLALSGLGFTPAAEAATHVPFTQQQKVEIQEIVRGYLLEQPEILLEVSQQLQERENEMRQAQTMKAIENNIDNLLFDEMAPVGGNLNGSITLVEFFDYRCPHCRRMKPVITELMKENPNIRIIYKEWPIFGGASDFSAKVALAAKKQGKYEAFHLALMGAPQRPDSEEDVLKVARDVGLDINQLKKDVESEAILEHLENNHKLAVELGLSGTPAYVLFNTPKDKASASVETLKPQYLPGAVPIEYFRAAIALLNQDDSDTE